jgi:hypothetical protein
MSGLSAVKFKMFLPLPLLLSGGGRNTLSDIQGTAFSIGPLKKRSRSLEYEL